MKSNNALERTVVHRGPHPGCQLAVGWLWNNQGQTPIKLKSLLVN